LSSRSSFLPFSYHRFFQPLHGRELRGGAAFLLPCPFVFRRLGGPLLPNSRAISSRSMVVVVFFTCRPLWCPWAGAFFFFFFSLPLKLVMQNVVRCPPPLQKSIRFLIASCHFFLAYRIFPTGKFSRFLCAGFVRLHKVSLSIHPFSFVFPAVLSGRFSFFYFFFPPVSLIPRRVRLPQGLFRVTFLSDPQGLQGRFLRR